MSLSNQLLLIPLVFAIIIAATLALCGAGIVGSVSAGVVARRPLSGWVTIAVGSAAGLVGGTIGIFAVSVIDQVTPLMSAVAPIALAAACAFGAIVRFLWRSPQAGEATR